MSTSSDPIDALVFTEIKNNVTDNASLDDFQQKFGLNTTKVDEIRPQLDDILTRTTIKRACCLNKGKTGTSSPYIINVRIPVPNSHNFSKETNADLNKKFNFIEKPVSVQDKFCPDGYTYKSNKCNNFYGLYCANIRSFYNTQTNGNWNDLEFSKYKPECACYNREQAAMKGINGAQNNCFMPGCLEGTGAYLDPTSKDPCSATICSQLIDMNNLKIGGTANIKLNLQNSCGKNSSTTSTVKDPSGASSTSNSESTSQPSSTNNSNSSTTTSTSKSITPSSSKSSSNTALLFGGGFSFLCSCIIICIIIVIYINKKKKN